MVERFCRNIKTKPKKKKKNKQKTKQNNFKVYVKGLMALKAFLEEAEAGAEAAELDWEDLRPKTV